MPSVPSKCDHCNRGVLERRKRRGVKGGLQTLLFVKPYSCSECKHHQVRVEEDALFRFLVFVIMVVILMTASYRVRRGPVRPQCVDGGITTNDQVVQMVGSGVPIKTIVNVIRSRPHYFVFGTATLLELRKTGVPDILIDAMVELERSNINPSLTIGCAAPSRVSN